MQYLKGLKDLSDKYADKSIRGRLAAKRKHYMRQIDFVLPYLTDATRERLQKKYESRIRLINWLLGGANK